MTLKERIAAVTAWVLKLKPVRVFLQYNAKGGPLLAAGLSYQALFAVFAAIWVGFAIAGFAIASDPQLQDALLQLLATNLPGLFDSSSSGDGGIIDTDALLSTNVLTWTGAIAAVGLLFTALGWLASGRDAVRLLFGIPTAPTNFLLLKLKDLGLAVGFGAALIVSTVLSAVSTSLLGAVLDVTGIGSDSMVGTVLGRALGLIVVLLIDTLVLGALYRVLAGIPIPFRRLAFGALLGGIGLGVLKLAGNLLLGGASNNPLIAGFAIIAGVLIFLNLVCQVILIFAAWIATGMDDAGIAADPVAAEKARIERERIAELERLADAAREPRGLARLFRRRRRADDDGGAS